MSVITIIGAGMMGTALCWPLVDNGHQVRLVGTPLDEEIITSLRQNGLHPRLRRQIPEAVHPFDHTQIQAALQGADILACGVSSFGVPWFTETVGPILKPEIPVISVTKGLVDQPDGSLQILPDYIDEHLPESLRGSISLNAIGGPCIAHELAARRQTGVVFCGRDGDMLARLQQAFKTPYYHIWVSLDLVGVEVCAALKNAYALGVGLAVGMFEKSGPDGLAQMYNPQAALFAQSCLEIGQFLELLGGGVDNVSWLPGAGDLYVTVFGGRTVRMGRLLGTGLPYPEARQIMAGETLESVEIIRRVGRALPELERRGLVQANQFPLLRHLYRIIHEGEKVQIPWEAFFQGIGEGG
jgi:glycerol-3-phosphate dehydrogenase (NAD(P)+)